MKCGQQFLTTQECLGSIATETGNPPPPGFALLHYLGEAWRIVRWDGEASRRVKDDPRVLPYGIVIWIFANTVTFLLVTYLFTKNPHVLSPERIAVLLAITLLSGAIGGLLHMGIVHLVTKYFCGGDGKFIQIIRPLLLASIVYLLPAIPFAAMLMAGMQGAGGALVVAGAAEIAAGIAWVAVMVMVFDVVDSMEHLTAFLVSMATGIGLRVIAAVVFKLPF